MKVILNEKIKIKKVEDIDNFDLLYDFCNSCAILCEINENKFIIKEQKISLDEYTINEFFDFLIEYIEIEIFYAWLGGKGTEFSIELKRKTRE